MTYDRTSSLGDPAALGNDGAVIDLSSEDFEVPNTVKAIEVVATGDLVVIPLNAGASITIADAPVGGTVTYARFRSLIQTNQNDAISATVRIGNITVRKVL